MPFVSPDVIGSIGKETEIHGDRWCVYSGAAVVFKVFFSSWSFRIGIVMSMVVVSCATDLR